MWGHISTLFLSEAPITDAERRPPAGRRRRWQPCVAALTGKQRQRERASRGAVSEENILKEAAFFCPPLF